MLTPHVSVAAFKAYPHYLDLDDLRTGDSSEADQDDELAQMLLAASAWADDFCDLGPGATLAAHPWSENVQARPDRRGRVTFHPDHRPLQTVTSLSWGYDPAHLTPVTDLTGLWIERQRRVIAPGMGTTPGMAALQLGNPWAGPLYCTWGYVAGYPSTTLAADTDAGDSTVTVTDPTGIVPAEPGLPATVLRIITPGAEEAGTVTTITGTTVTLAAPLAKPHTAGDAATAMPISVVQAVIYYTIALLERGASEPEGRTPGARVEPSLLTGSVAAREGSGLVGEAQRLLEPYVRVW